MPRERKQRATAGGHLRVRDFVPVIDESREELPWREAQFGDDSFA